ncbi:MAG TPA: alpha/beta hydrolase [Acidimicrobiaceae bacterium]|nr:alpha/beta hydrolase [Acidimicrobiaceae bacterium]
MSNEIDVIRSALPQARRPDRSRRVDVGGIEVSVVEWGDEMSQPILLAHGGFDFAGTWDLFAPLLAEQGFRVVAWDQRGHGDSDMAALYTWEADMRDAAHVIESLGTSKPIPVLGHSKGGGMMNQLAEVLPHRVGAVINLDGIPNERGFTNQVDRSDVKALATELNSWLDHRRKAGQLSRRADTIEGLAERRKLMNPRLSIEWLQYLVTVGARRDDDGWRWKIDPTLRFGPSGAWRPEWAIPRLRGLHVPYLGVIGTEKEEMGWGTTPDEAFPILPEGAEFHALANTGHFVHIERPDHVAAITVDFLERVL